MPTTGPYAAVNVAGDNWEPDSGTLTEAVATNDNVYAVSDPITWNQSTPANHTNAHAIRFNIDTAAVEADIPVDATVSTVFVEYRGFGPAGATQHVFMLGVDEAEVFEGAFVEDTESVNFLSTTTLTTRSAVTAATYDISFYDQGADNTPYAITLDQFFFWVTWDSVATNPPEAPTGFTATPHATDPNRVDLAWTDNSGGASQETGFEIYRSPYGYPFGPLTGGHNQAPSWDLYIPDNWTLIHTTAADAESYSDTTVDEASFYGYAIRAVNGDGESSFGTGLAVDTIDEALTLPPAPVLDNPTRYEEFIFFPLGAAQNFSSTGTSNIIQWINLYRSTLDPDNPEFRDFQLVAELQEPMDFTDHTLVEDDANTYFYIGTLVNDTGESADSNEIEVAPLWWIGCEPGIGAIFSILEPCPPAEPTAEPAVTGWWLSLDGYAGAAAVVSEAVPADPRSFDEIVAFATGSTDHMGGSPGPCCVSENRLIFARGGYAVGTDSPSFRISNGTSDRELGRLPKVSTTVSKAIMTMLSANGTVYLTTLDSGTTSADYSGRVYSLDVNSGVLTPIGLAITTGHVPYALAWHANRLWLGTHRQSTAATGKIMYFRPGIDSAWTDDRNLSSDGVTGVGAMLSYQGKLYVGTTAAAGTFGTVEVRDTLNAWTTSLTATGGTAAANNGFIALAEFEDNLYASFWNDDATPVSKIYKFDGTSWSTVYTGSGDTLKPFIAFATDTNLLLAIAGGKDVEAGLIATTDGTTWADRTQFLVQDDPAATALPCWGIITV